MNIVMYHYVRSSKTKFPGITALSPEDFATQLSWLQSEYDILHYDTFRELVHSGMPPAKPVALLTFDDGFVDHYETVLPLLSERGLSGVFFACDGVYAGEPKLLNVHKIHLLLSEIGADRFLLDVQEQLQSPASDFVLDDTKREGLYIKDTHDLHSIKKFLNYELPYDISDAILNTIFTEHLGSSQDAAKRLYLSPTQVQEMASAGMTFGSHTASHRVLSRFSKEEQKEEVTAGIDLVRCLTNQEDVPFCYPYGGEHTYTDETQQILKAAGYTIGFAVGRRYCDLAKDKPLTLPRHDTNAFPPLTAKPPLE